jgi:hypothetical protein
VPFPYTTIVVIPALNGVWPFAQRHGQLVQPMARRRPLRHGPVLPSARWCYPALQETDGHVHWPLGETVNPQLLPLPLGVAFITYSLG